MGFHEKFPVGEVKIFYIRSNLAILLDSGGWVWNHSFDLLGFARKSGATAPETSC